MLSMSSPQLHLFWKPAIPPQVDFLSACTNERDHLDPFLLQPGALAFDSKAAVTTRGNEALGRDHALLLAHAYPLS